MRTSPSICTDRDRRAACRWRAGSEARCVPIAARALSRAAWITSGSAIGVWSARNASLGNASASAAKAGSPPALASADAAAATMPCGGASFSPCRCAATCCSSTCVAYCWPDSQRTNGSVSYSARNCSRSCDMPFELRQAPRSRAAATASAAPGHPRSRNGALPRSAPELACRPARSLRRRAASATPCRRRRAIPSPAGSPAAALVGCPGVGAVCWRTVSV